MQEVAGPIHRTYRSNDAKARRKDRKGNKAVGGGNRISQQNLFNSWYEGNHTKEVTQLGCREDCESRVYGKTIPETA